MKRVLLIDADILVYQVATSAEIPTDWGDGLWTLHSELPDAVERLDRQIEELKETLKADELVFALTTMETNFRKLIYPPYKAHRKATRKPLVWLPLREHLHSKYRVFERSHLEGDDCLGILATKVGPLFPGCPVSTKRILVSIDKDFKTIPCTYYNMKHKETITVSESEANLWHMTQTLTGDTTDGYPGCPGIGPKKAEAILAPTTIIKDVTEQSRLMWKAVAETYKKAGLSEDVALQQARCARILRACDYDFKKKEPKLWEPPR